MNAIKLFKQYGSLKEYSKGEYLFFQGESRDEIFLLLQGEIELRFFPSEEEKELVIGFLQSPLFIGEELLFGEESYLYSVRIHSPKAQVLIFYTPNFLKLLKTEQKALTLLIESLFQKEKVMIEALTRINLSDTRERILRAFKRYRNKKFQTKEIAELAGIRYETASRILNELAKKGIIRKENKRYYI